MSSLAHRLLIHNQAMGHSCIDFIKSQGLMVCRICGRLQPAGFKPMHKLYERKLLGHTGDFKGKLT